MVKSSGREKKPQIMLHEVSSSFILPYPCWFAMTVSDVVYVLLAGVVRPSRICHVSSSVHSIQPYRQRFRGKSCLVFLCKLKVEIHFVRFSNSACSIFCFMFNLKVKLKRKKTSLEVRVFLYLASVAHFYLKWHRVRVILSWQYRCGTGFLFPASASRRLRLLVSSSPAL